MAGRWGSTIVWRATWVGCYSSGCPQFYKNSCLEKVASITTILCNAQVPRVFCEYRICHGRGCVYGETYSDYCNGSLSSNERSCCSYPSPSQEYKASFPKRCCFCGSRGRGVTRRPTYCPKILWCKRGK